MTAKKTRASLPGPAPVTFTESTQSQSIHMLMVADQVLEVLRYRGGVDMRNEQDVLTAIQEIWPEMIGRMDDAKAVAEKRARLPQDQGMYYLAIFDSEEGERVPALIPEGDVLPRVIQRAIDKLGTEGALKVLHAYGLLPRA